jgi:hypothetical protein
MAAKGLKLTLRTISYIEHCFQFVLFNAGNGGGCANRIYDSKGGTGSVYSVPKANVWIQVLPRLCTVYYFFIFHCSTRHGLLHSSVREETCKCIFR